MKKYIFPLLAFLTAIVVLLNRCTLNKQPEQNNVYQQFLKHKELIQTITDYMVDTGYVNIHLSVDSKTMKVDADGTMSQGLVEIEISDDAVFSAVQQLFESKAYIDIDKHGNTIIFLQWANVHDIGCGIAYSTNHIDYPSVEYCTELVPLSEPGWYYFVYDFNQWRVNKSKGR